MKRKLRLSALLLAVIYCWGGFAVSGISMEDLSAPVTQEVPEAGTNTIETSAEPVQYSRMFYLPHNMRGIIISPEIDFLLTPDDGRNEVIAQLDEIFFYIQDIGLNTVIIETSVEDRVYYDLDMNRNGGTDYISLAVERAQSFFLNTYLIYDIGHALNPFENDTDSNAIDRLISEAYKLTLKYPCNGIILDNYYNNPEINNFSRYMRNGAGIGHENWLFDSTEYLFETAGRIIRMTDNSIPVGVMINDEWANAHTDGFADTKKYIEQEYVDFIMVRCYGSLTDSNLPFEETAQWWGELCEAGGIPMYLIHYNEKIGNGWGEAQLLQQLKTAKESISAYSGSVFNSYAALKANLLNSAGTLKMYYADLIDEDSLMQELEMTSPRNLTFTTFEPTVDFMGTFDRNFDVYFNGNRINLNEAGNFFFPEPLAIGFNVFTITHKDQTVTYRIERRIIVMREINSSIAEGKALRVDGGTAITLEAVAYRGAAVTATINGQTVQLREQTGTLQDEDVNSAYTSFTGRYTVPDGIIGVEQPLGRISVNASYMGYTRNIPGATVTVNAKPAPPPPVNLNPIMFDERELGDGEIVGTLGAVRERNEQVTFVRVNNNHTHVFSARTTGTVFDPRFSQLPAGTLDYYRSSVGGFYTTESGKRFNADDTTLINGTGIGENALTVLESGTAGGSSYFEIALDTKISYNVEVTGLTFSPGWGSDFNISSFEAEYVYVTFDNVTSVTKLPDFKANLVFSSGSWEQVTIDGIVKFRLILRLRTRGVYAGNSAYYNSNGNLMLTFPVLTNSLAGMTIVIDPGHGYGSSATVFDPGAIGHITEQTANLAVAKLLEAKFTALGANAIRLRTEETFYLTRNRPIVARSLGCDLFISLHSNRVANNPEARGAEVFYYTPFSQPLAAAVSESIASYFTRNVYSDGANKNRGAKNSYFWVTVQQDFPSVLVEMGFVSNYEEAMALANPTHQNGIADAIVQGVQKYLARSPISHSPDGSVTIPDRTPHPEPVSEPPVAETPQEPPSEDEPEEPALDFSTADF
ncbi:MAG: N-acetylmuramoyl-L-alanine amidase [Oscillospiraceae bacterium]|jgi:N-acetylmuramoyl-L-alanine amidase|nr:N-acetylmuramoyl-L-alanine amidase [Oscillospiraceae bacterium]